MKDLERKLDKKETLWYSGIALIIILVAFIINFTVLFPIKWETIWIYGIISLFGGIVAYLISLFFLESYHYFLEILSIGIIAAGEFLILAYFIAFETIWISVYVLIPSSTYLGLAILTYNLHSPEIKDRRDINGGVGVILGALILLIIEAVIRGFILLQLMIIPVLSIILIVGGLIFYIIVIWTILGKPSYIISLIAASIISIGILFIEIYDRNFYPLFMTIFIAPAIVFFLLLLINYYLSKTNTLPKSKTTFGHQSGLTPKSKEKSESAPD